MIGPKAIIHLDRLIHNYQLAKQKTGNKQIMAFVKANAYGHGAVPVAKALESVGADWFGVFTPGEAIELRKGGVSGNIMVFCRFQSEFLEKAKEWDLILNISCENDLNELITFHGEMNSSPRFHVKIDTGMTRLGLPIDSVSSFFNLLKKNSHLNYEGIYSHFATADEGDLNYANFQLEQFNGVLDTAEKMDLSFQHIHFSNSGSVLNLPESYFTMVRVGLLLYGAFPSNEVPQDLPIQPVMEFKAPVVNLRKVKKGTLVSYGGVWSASQDTIIGVVQAGFADGFPRAWFEKGSISFKGERYKIAGRVCMDQLTVDFFNANVQCGDEVLLFGKNKIDSIGVEDIAERIGSTAYVLLTAIGGRTERIFSGLE